MPPLGPRPRVPAKPKVRVKPKAGKGSPVPRPRGQSLTEAPSLTPKEQRESQRVADELKPRGHAPTIFERPLATTPTQRMVVKQRRKSARAVLRVEQGERGSLESDYGRIPAEPTRPLTSREVDAVLSSPAGRDVQAQVRKVVKVRKPGGGFKLTPAAIVGDIPAELKGTGVLEKGVTALGSASAQGWEQALANVGLPGVGKALGAASKDAYGLVAGAVPSVYLPAAEVAKGRPGKAVGMVAEGVKETVKHPGQHPVSLLLLLRGGEGAVSRAGGEALRAAPKGSALHEFADTQRPPLHLGGGAMEERRYSTGIVENRLQKAADRRAIRNGRGVQVRVPVRDAGGKLRYTAKVNAIQATERQLRAPHVLGGRGNRRLDIEAGKGNTRLRNMRQTADRIMVAAKPKHADAVAMVSEGVIKSPRTAARDLEAHLKQLEIERSGLHDPADLAHNAENVRQVETLLGDRDFLANPAKAFKAARVYATSHREYEAARHEFGDLTAEQVKGRPLLPFAVRELGLKYNEDTRRFEDPNGRPVSSDEIARKFVNAGGDLENLAYVPTDFESTGPANFYGSQLRRPGAETKRFTGVAARRGTYDRSYDVLRQQLVNAAVKVARHRSVNNIVNTFAVRQPGGKWLDYKSGRKEARAQEAATGEKYVAVTVARQTAPETLLEDLTPAELHQVFRPAEPGDSHVVLFPERVWNRLEAHESGRGRIPAERKFQQITQTFRHVVLSLSTKWLTGNGLEAYLRMQINELTPVGVARTIAAGRKLEEKVKALGPEGVRKVEELRAASAQGLYLSQHSLELHHADDELIQWGRKVRQAGFGPGDKIGPKGIGDLWDGYRHGISAINGAMELSVYFYALGREARSEVRSFTGSWRRSLNLADDAYADVARGLLDSNNVARYAKAVDAIRGRYSNLSPDGRWMVTTFTPFASWYVNSLHFFALTLPGHHPFKTGVVTAASVGTQEQRRKLDLPPWAQGIPLGNGKVLPLQHYLPTGIAERGTEGLPQLVLPQVQSAGLNLSGLDWTGRPLPPGTDRNALALNTMFETFVPLVTRVRQIEEKGGKSLPDSTVFKPKVKAGTGTSVGAGIRKAFDPFRTTRTNPSATGGTPSVDDVLQVHGMSNRFLDGSAQTQNRFLDNGPSVDDVLSKAGH